MSILSDLISVIVPIFNVEKYLPRCLTSLANQTYPNLEVILVDDGSPDHCEEICRHYTKQYHFFHYYKKTNGGLSDARNYGIRKASGKYIGFVDSDDWIDQNMYQVLYEDIIDHHASIAIVGFDMVTDYSKQSIKKIGKTKELDRENAIKNLFRYDSFGNFAWNKLYKRELFADIDYPVGKRLEDLGTTYRLFLRANIITYNSMELYHYNQREGSILHDINKAKNGYFEDKLEQIQERFLSLREMFPGMEENTAFYLNAVFDCLPYLSEYSILFDKTISVFRSVDKRSWKNLTRKRRIKALILSVCPGIFMRFFRAKK